ncbi:MAG: protein kinase, partial [Cyanobacteria bacterium P01_G01_bin.49]
MNYCRCINPNCPNPQNPKSEFSCQACGTEIFLEGRYRVIKELGGGGIGRIYEIEIQDTTKVLKVFKLDKNKSPDAFRLFKQEVDVLAKLNHPGIPKVESDSYFTVSIPNNEEELHCFVMEKIEGENLKDWLYKIRKRPIRKNTVIDWLTQITKILSEVHKNKLWHRDIKPSNIMLRPTGQLALIDFGTAKEITTTFIKNQVNPNQISTGVISQGYTPHEQQNGRTVMQSDFFALGRTFVFLLTGTEPYELIDSNNSEFNWHSAISQNISASLLQLIDDLMANEPSSRPKDCQAILERLEEIKTGSPASAPLPPPLPPRNGRKNQTVIIGIISLVLAIVTTTIWAIFYRNSPARAEFQQCNQNLTKELDQIINTYDACKSIIDSSKLNSKDLNTAYKNVGKAALIIWDRAGDLERKEEQKNNKIQEVTNYFEEAEKYNDIDPQAKFYLALMQDFRDFVLTPENLDCLPATKRYEQAINLYKDIDSVKTVGNDFFALLELGHFLVSRDRDKTPYALGDTIWDSLNGYQKAIRLYDKLLQVPDENARYTVLLSKAKAQLLDNKYEDARKSFAEALKIEPDAYQIKYYLGNSYAQIGNYMEAVEEYDSVTENYQTRHYYYALRDSGFAHYMISEYAKAQERFERAIAL